MNVKVIGAAPIGDYPNRHIAVPTGISDPVAEGMTVGGSSAAIDGSTLRALLYEDNQG